MVSKCANPDCSTPFRNLRTGKLIRVEYTAAATTVVRTQLEFGEPLPIRRAEFFWLCDDCSSRGLAFQKDGSITAPARCAGAVSASL
jgi:hypothetical protein